MKDDKIYEMLNDAEIDLNEYEVEELSSEEKERYKTRIRMEVKRMNMETRNKKNKNIRKIINKLVYVYRKIAYMDIYRIMEIMFETMEGEKFDEFG